MYFLRWLTNRTVRKAAELEEAVRKLLNHQRDLLAPPAVGAVEDDLRGFHTMLRNGATESTIQDRMHALEMTASKWLRPYPHHGLRDNLVMLLEIAVLIVGSRAFLIQPMVIPTGSAQPTLWGVTYEDLRDTQTPIPSWPMRLWEKVMYGVSYYEIIAPADLEVTGAQDRPKMFFPFVKRQYLYTTAGPIPVWFPPDDFPRQLGMLDESRRGLKRSRFRKGEVIARARVTTGDHLFVERVSYTFAAQSGVKLLYFVPSSILG